MEIHLINCDLWEYVDGSVESTGQDENQKKLDDKNNKRALAAIISGVKTHIYIEIRELKSGKEVWDRLRNIFESKGFSRVAALIEQLVLIRFSECSGMDEYLNKKMKIAQQLKSIDTEIKSGVLAALIFVSIPDYFKPLIMALENCGLELTTDLVKERLLAEAAKYENDGKESALISNKQDIRGYKMHKFRGKCNNCHKYGHKSKICRFPKGYGESKKSETGLIITALGTGNLSRDDWYVDSGASVHLTGRSDWLRNIKNISGDDIVTTASGEQFKITSIGETSVVLNIEGRKVETPIREVRYVPGLKFNLISCKQLAKRGVKTVFENERTCEMRDGKSGNLIAIAKSTDGELYKLACFKEKSVVLSARVENTLDIWHRRLGHLSTEHLKRLEAGMVENEELPDDSIQNDEQTAEPIIPEIGEEKAIKRNEDNQIQQRAYPGREHRVPERLKDYVLCAARDIDNIEDPKSVRRRCPETIQKAGKEP
ncbi:hypothetical protein JTB14_029822 [Gonioctena quinquepunctata]|nr:hypothetical protein JTB14_029822 [Gonioctena quinquepunctata]